MRAEQESCQKTEGEQRGRESVPVVGRKPPPRSPPAWLELTDELEVFWDLQPSPILLT